mgnify:CR=1
GKTWVNERKSTSFEDEKDYYFGF